MAQTWHNLLFAHWPVAPEVLRPHLAPGLTLDTFDGQAWVGLILFRLSAIRLRGCPPVPLMSAFPEINVRTYIRDEGRPAILFLSLDADNLLGIELAKLWYHLPYLRANMTFRADGDQVAFTSHRTSPRAPFATFTGSYSPTGPVAYSAPGSLDHWLTERYRFYSVDGHGGLHRGDIYHDPWPLQPAAATIAANTLAQAHGIPLPDTPPLCHYARQMPAVFWLPERVAPAQERPLPSVSRALIAG
jgi:uncharacterized protein YqjF (DUF2071 family)